MPRASPFVVDITNRDCVIVICAVLIMWIFMVNERQEKLQAIKGVQEHMNTKFEQLNTKIDTNFKQLDTTSTSHADTASLGTNEGCTVNLKPRK